MFKTSKVKLIILLSTIMIAMISSILFLSSKYSQSPYDFLTKQVVKNVSVENAKEPPTGKTSKMNKSKIKKNYSETIKKYNSKKELTSEDMRTMILDNATFILQITGSKKKNIDSTIEQITSTSDRQVFKISPKDLATYNENAGQYPISATAGSVIYIKGGLVTSMFDSNFQKDTSKIGETYKKWLNTVDID